MLQASVLTIYTIHSASKSISTSIYMHNTNPNSITIFFNLFIIINVLFCWLVFLKRFIFIVCFYGCYKLLLHFMSFLKFLSYTHNFYQYVPSPVQFKICPNLFVFRGEAMGLVALFKSSCLLLWKCCPLFMFNVFSIHNCVIF